MSTSLLENGFTSKLVNMEDADKTSKEKKEIAAAETAFAHRVALAKWLAGFKTDGALAAVLTIKKRRQRDPIKAQTVQYLRTKANSSEFSPELANICNVRYEWLTLGEGEMIDELHRHAENTEGMPPAPVNRLPQNRRLPVVGTAQLGPDGFWNELEYPVGHGDGSVDAPTQDPNSYCIRVRGDSMFPAIKSGMFVIVEPNLELIPGEYALVKTKDGRSMVKELLWHRDGEYALASVNPNFGRLTLKDADVEFAHYCWPMPASKWRP